MASLLELLISQNIINAEQAREAANLAEETGAFIGRILVAQGAVEESRLAAFLAEHCTERIPSNEITVDKDIAHLLPERLMRRYRVFPLQQDAKGVLTLAVVDPLSIGGLDQVKRRLCLPMRLVLVEAATVDRLLAQSVSYDEATVETGDPPSPIAASVGDAEPPMESQLPDAPKRKEDGMPVPEHDTSKLLVHPVSFTSASAGVDEFGFRSPSDRVPFPSSWAPEALEDELTGVLRDSYEVLRSIIQDSEQKYAVLVGPDVARNRVLRALFTASAIPANARYIDLTAFEYPEEPPPEFPSVLMIDGLDAVSLESEEEQRAILRDISRAFSSRVPLIAGLRIAPGESSFLPGGLKLTLGLGKMVNLALPETSSRTEAIEGYFFGLVDETIRWSEESFPAAGLESLLSEIKAVYENGNKKDAILKARSAVASRITHLVKE